MFIEHLLRARDCMDCHGEAREREMLGSGPRVEGPLCLGGTLPRDSGEPPSGRTGVLIAPCLHRERPASLSFVSKPSKPETGAATRR